MQRLLDDTHASVQLATLSVVPHCQWYRHWQSTGGRSVIRQILGSAAGRIMTEAAAGGRAAAAVTANEWGIKTASRLW